LSRRPADAAETADFLFMLYIDDHHDLLHGTISESRSLSWFESIGNWSLLGSVISCVRTGLSIHQRKLVWASNVPSKTLGIVIDLTGTLTTFYPEPKKLEQLVQASWNIHRRGGLLVQVGDRSCHGVMGVGHAHSAAHAFHFPGYVPLGGQAVHDVMGATPSCGRS
jgi:hypothetical protein